MGLWWKKVDATPPSEGAVTFEGDADATSKRWPVLWRFSQNWHILEVDRFHCPFELYFWSHGQAMYCRRLIRGKYVAVRVGPEAVTFWAETREVDSPPRLMKTGLIVPAIFRADQRDIRHQEDAEYFKKRAVFV